MSAETCSQITCCDEPLFTPPIEPSTGNFLISVTVTPTDSGEVTGAGEVEQSSTVTLEATPAMGFAFVAWTDTNGFVLSEDAEWIFTVTQNLILIAVFE